MFGLSLFKLPSFCLQAPGVLLGANGQPGSMAIGNTLMLLMKPPNAQGGSAFSFPHAAGSQLLLFPLCLLKIAAPAVPPEVLLWQRRYKRGETRCCHRESLCPKHARLARTALDCPPANF